MQTLLSLGGTSFRIKLGIKLVFSQSKRVGSARGKVIIEVDVCARWLKPTATDRTASMKGVDTLRGSGG